MKSSDLDSIKFLVFWLRKKSYKLFRIWTFKGGGGGGCWVGGGGSGSPNLPTHGFPSKIARKVHKVKKVITFLDARIVGLRRAP